MGDSVAGTQIFSNKVFEQSFTNLMEIGHKPVSGEDFRIIGEGLRKEHEGKKG